MKKQMKKIISLLLVLALSCTGIAVFADDNISDTIIGGTEINPQFIAIRSCSRALEKESSWGKLYCDGETNSYDGYTAGVTVKLQKYDGGWETIKTWSDAPDSTFAAVGEYYYVTSGTYRLKVKHKAYNSNGSVADSFEAYSQEVIV